MTYGPMLTPIGYPLEESLPLGFTEHLRVSDLVDPSLTWHHRCANGDRAGPSSPSDLVNPYDNGRVTGPQLALNS